MTHCELILEILKDGKPHSIFEILERGRGTNWAVRSRLADLRKQEYKIDTLFFPETKQNAWYQLKENKPNGKRSKESPAEQVLGENEKRLGEVSPSGTFSQLKLL